MRNLKRALSLALAAMMLIGMMVVSAGAASKDFTDKDEIKHTEAVNTMVALNVISGKEDGSYFDPTGTLTRAEMAKIISYVMNGGVEPVLGVKDKPTYSDINGHWAEAYIEYATSMGIINGDGSGKFNPDGTLTATQAAKMFLTAMGYNANVFGFTGSSWDTNTNRYANEAGLYKELGGLLPNAPISRDDACQMAYNAIQATLMVRTWSQDMATGQITEGYALDPNGNDLLQEKFSAKAEYAYMSSISYDKVKDEYTYTFTHGNESPAGVTFGGSAIDASEDLTQTTLYSAEDYSALFGQKVKVIYKNSASEKYPVYGIYAVAEKVVSGVLNDISGISGKDLKVAGTKYTMTNAVATIDVYTYNDTTNSVGGAGGIVEIDDVIAGITTGTEIRGAWTFDIFDNTGDGRGDVMVIYPETAQKVTYVGTASINAGAVYNYDKDTGLYTNSSNEYDFAEVVKGDYVAIAGSAVTGVPYTAKKLDAVTGKVNGLDTSGRKVQLDGEWYNYIQNMTFTLGDTVKVQLLNGIVVASSVEDTASKDLLFVIASENGNTMSKAQADVLFADGTRAVININKKDGSTNNLSNALAIGALYTYTKNTDNTYNVTAVSASNKAGYNTYNTATATAGTTSVAGLYTEATSSAAATLGGNLIADDAVIFVKSTVGTTTTYSVIAGKTLKTYKTTAGQEFAANGSGSAMADIASQMLLDTTDGIYGVKVATMNVTSRIGTTSTYGYVTSAPYTSKDANDVTVYNYTMWTVDGEKTVVDTNNPGTKGSFVKYETNTDGTVTSSAHGMTAVAITGYNAGEKVITLSQASGAALGKVNAKIADDAQIMFVNTTDVVGAEGGELALAQRLADGSYIMNAYAYYDGTEVTAIIFDVTNDLDDTAAHQADTNGAATGTAGAAISATKTNSPTNVSSVATEYAYAVEGEYVKVTATLGGAANGATLTATPAGTNVKTTNTGSITLPASGTASGDTFSMYVLIENDGSGAIAGPITIDVDD